MPQHSEVEEDTLVSTCGFDAIVSTGLLVEKQKMPYMVRFRQKLHGNANKSAARVCPVYAGHTCDEAS